MAIAAALTVPSARQHAFAAQDVQPAPQPTQAAPAAPAAQAAPAAAGATVRGSLPIVQRKRPIVKEYGAQPAIKVEPPDGPVSVVWIGSGFPPLAAADAPLVEVKQAGYQFRPEVTVIRTGTRVSFPNTDPNYHSVFSLSGKEQFDIGRFVAGEEPQPRIFENPGIVDLFCDVHDHMRGHIIVADTPWFARSDGEGKFEIRGIAPGTHAVKIWVGPRRRPIEKVIEVVDGQVLEVDWSSTDG